MTDAATPIEALHCAPHFTVPPLADAITMTQRYSPSRVSTNQKAQWATISKKASIDHSTATPSSANLRSMLTFCIDGRLLNCVSSQPRQLSSYIPTKDSDSTSTDRPKVTLYFVLPPGYSTATSPNRDFKFLPVPIAQQQHRSTDSHSPVAQLLHHFTLLHRILSLNAQPSTRKDFE